MEVLSQPEPMMDQILILVLLSEQRYQSIRKKINEEKKQKEKKTNDNDSEFFRPPIGLTLSISAVVR